MLPSNYAAKDNLLHVRIESHRHLPWSWLKIYLMQAPVGQKNSTGIWQANKTAVLTALQRRKSQELETECLTDMSNSLL